jgi:hypothetical protein
MENVMADNMVHVESAATAKSVSPFISPAMTYVIVAVGDASKMSAGR